MTVRGHPLLVTGPTSEPVSLAEARAQCRLDSSVEDVLLRGLISAARQHVETTLTWRALLTQTWEMYLDEWPACEVIELPRPPLQSVTSIKYYDTADTEYTLSSSYYQVDAVSEPGRIALKTGYVWPTVTLRPVNGVVVRLVAGWTSAANVPEPLKLAIRLLVGHWFENREGSTFGQQLAEIPLGVDALALPYRAWY